MARIWHLTPAQERQARNEALKRRAEKALKKLRKEADKK